VSPLSELEPEASALDLLPALLEEEGIERGDSKALIEAYRDQRPLLDAIHKKRGRQ